MAAKIVVANMNIMYTGDPYPYTVSHVHDYEFKIIAALDFDLIIFHPYRPMMQYASDAGFTDLLATAWPILNDSFRSDACLLHPPYIIAIACLFMAGTVMDRDMRGWISSLKIETQDVIEAAQLLTAMYNAPSPNKLAGTHLDFLNKKLQSHFGPRIQSIPGPISKKPPSSRPKSRN